MPTPPDVVESWRTVGEIIGAFLGALGIGFWTVYQKARATERDRVEHTPEVAAKAVGAAFVDKSASDAIIDMAGDVRSIRQIHERREKADQEDDLLDRAVERLRLEDKGKAR